jgi:hypothetical protein
MQFQKLIRPLFSYHSPAKPPSAAFAAILLSKQECASPKPCATSSCLHPFPEKPFFLLATDPNIKQVLTTY